MAPPPQRSSQPTRRTHFVRRLSLYLFGIAIGFLFLGIVQSMKQAQAARKANAAQQQTNQQTNQQAQPQPAPGVTTRLAEDPPSDP